MDQSEEQQQPQQQQESASPAPAPEPAPPPQAQAQPQAQVQEEEPFSLQSMIVAGIGLATANDAVQQLRGLTLLNSLASGSDEALKTELGKAGVFTLMARILNGGVATQGSVSPLTMFRARQLATSITWVASIAHAENKTKGTVAMNPLVKQLAYFLPAFEKRLSESSAPASTESESQPQTATDEEFPGDQELFETASPSLKYEVKKLRLSDAKVLENLLQMTGRAIWSLCYGVPANQQLLFQLGGVQLLVRLLKLTAAEFETRYTAAGALWHAAMLPEAATTIVNLDAIPHLISLIRSPQPATETFVPCLTLCALLNNSSKECVDKIQSSEALPALSSWVRAQNVKEFKSPFVWTTLKPLVALLESRFTPVIELGCFMTVAEVCNKSEISKMFTEGVVAQLKLFALAHPTIDIDTFNPATEEEEEAVLEDGRKCSKVASFLALLALRRLQIDVTKPPPSSEAAASTNSESSSSFIPSFDGKSPPRWIGITKPCLICMDNEKDICFAPCGHVATCEECSQIVRARKDPCLVCRNPIESFIKLYFV